MSTPGDGAWYPFCCDQEPARCGYCQCPVPRRISMLIPQPRQHNPLLGDECCRCMPQRLEFVLVDNRLIEVAGRHLHGSGAGFSWIIFECVHWKAELEHHFCGFTHASLVIGHYGIWYANGYEYEGPTVALIFHKDNEHWKNGVDCFWAIAWVASHCNIPSRIYFTDCDATEYEVWWNCCRGALPTNPMLVHIDPCLQAGRYPPAWSGWCLGDKKYRGMELIVSLHPEDCPPATFSFPSIFVPPLGYEDELECERPPSLQATFLIRLQRCFQPGHILANCTLSRAGGGPWNRVQYGLTFTRMPGNFQWGYTGSLPADCESLARHAISVDPAIFFSTGHAFVRIRPTAQRGVDYSYLALGCDPLVPYPCQPPTVGYIQLSQLQGNVPGSKCLRLTYRDAEAVIDLAPLEKVYPVSYDVFNCCSYVSYLSFIDQGTEACELCVATQRRGILRVCGGIASNFQTGQLMFQVILGTIPLPWGFYITGRQDWVMWGLLARLSFNGEQYTADRQQFFMPIPITIEFKLFDGEHLVRKAVGSGYAQFSLG